MPLSGSSAVRRTPSLASLRLFLQLAASGSFRETARLAHVSQPALSRTIRLLEEDLGVRLFDRTPRRVSLTAPGQALLATAERLVADVDASFQALEQSFSGQQGRIVLGALPSIAAFVLPPLIAAFQSTHPGVELVLRDQLSGSLCDQLDQRQIDFAITTPPEDVETFSFRPLFDDGFALVARKADLPALPDPCSWSLFADRPFIAMAPPSSVRLATDAAFVRLGLPVKPLFECGQLATVGGLVAAGLGMTALPLSTLPMVGAGQGGIGWRMLAPPAVTRTIGIARRRDRSLSPACNALLEYLLRHRAMIRFVEERYQ